MKVKSINGVVAKVMAFMCAFSMCVSASTVDAQAADASLLNTYGSTYGHSGTCINLYQLRDSPSIPFCRHYGDPFCQRVFLHHFLACRQVGKLYAQ